MKKIHASIEIISSPIAGLSSMGAASRQGILEVLQQYYDDVRITLVQTLQDMNEIALRKPSLIFLGLKYIPVGINGENKLWITDFLDVHGIAYTGSGQPAHEVELNKSFAKQVVSENGIQTAGYLVSPYGVVLAEELVDVPYPLFVKPTDKGGGQGINESSVVHTFKQLQDRVMYISDSLQADSLIEQYLSGREFSVAVLKDEYTEGYTAMPLELIAPLNKNGDRFLSERIKSEDTETFVAVAGFRLRSMLQTMALQVFVALGAQDYGRIDIRLDAAGEPYFLEANLIPSLLRDYGNFPKACLLNSGLSFEQTILQIVRLGINRSPVVRTQQFLTGATAVEVA